MYLDILFAVNALPDAAFLCAVGYLSGAALKARRIISASCIGGLTAVAAAFSSNPLARFPLLAGAALAMTALAFGIGSPSVCALRTCLLFAVSCMHAGAFSILGDVWNTSLLPFGAILFGAAAVTLLASVFRTLIGTQKQRDMIYTVRTICGKRSAELRVLSDTGHTLLSPLTNRPVIIITRTAIRPLLPYPAQIALDMERFDAAALAEAFHAAGLKGVTLIPYHSVGGNGLICGFVPDHVILDGRESDMMLAVTDAELSENGTYVGLMGVQ